MCSTPPQRQILGVQIKMIIEKPIYIEEAADALGMSTRTLRRRVHEGAISFFRTSGKIAFEEAEIRRFHKARIIKHTKLS